MNINVLVVDNSLFMRQLLTDLLNADPEVTVVDTAKSGEEALKKIPKLKPHCITLDIAMPGMSGLETLKRIMESHPTPVVIVSAYSPQEAEMTMECLHAGAVGFVQKPSGELSLDIEKVKEQLIYEVKSAAQANLDNIRRFLSQRPKPLPKKKLEKGWMVCIGASTGGPQALEILLEMLPAHFHVPIIVIQHMPARTFTESLAKRLDTLCELVVKVAREGEKIRESVVYIVPGEYSLSLRQDHIHLSKCSAQELNASIDITMLNLTEVFKDRLIGIILSGMGKDGLKGMEAIKENGGKTICEDETALLFGMPKAVIHAGLADKVLSVNQIGAALVEWLQ